MPITWLTFFILANTILAIFIVFLYAVLYKAIPGTGIKKGLTFGLLMYPMSVLIPMFSIWAMFRVAEEAVLLFTLEQLIEILVYGAIIGLIYKERLSPKL
jgi:predicted neutral ceramidase superfamily lipid hydrolase